MSNTSRATTAILLCTFVLIVSIFSYLQLSKQNYAKHVTVNKYFKANDPIEEQTPNEDNIKLKERDESLNKAATYTQIKLNESDTESTTGDRDVIHVGFVCVGIQSMGTLGRMLKTLLHHTNNPIKFSIVGDYKCFKKVDDLLKSQKDKPTQLEMHDWTKYKSEVDFIPNTHYSGVYGLLKLIVQDILPVWEKRIILLDTDLIFNSDIAHLWRHSDHFNSSQAVGVAPNLTGWYFSGGHWPAIEGGFNTGVMVLDLIKLRLVEYTRLWKSDLLKPILQLKQTQLGDQDVINVVAVNNPQLFYELPCAWNVQWRKDLTNCFTAPEEKSNIKILHWNRPDKHVPAHVQPEIAQLFDKIKALGLD